MRATSRAAAAWRRAALAQERAERDEAAALHHADRAAETGREIHAQLAAARSRMAACHRSSARLQEAYARRMSGWEAGYGAQPRFMTGVAEACGTDSAALTLVGDGRAQLAVAASDEPARVAQDLEYVLGEGPMRDATADRGLVFAAQRGIEMRWPGYGPELVTLGISSVAAVPLQTSRNCIGALAVFDPRPGLVGSSELAELADALTRTVLLDPDADPELYGGADHRVVVHQAAGMLSVQASCSIDDALALIKARAFGAGVPTETIAQQVVDGEMKLG